MNGNTAALATSARGFASSASATPRPARLNCLSSARHMQSISRTPRQRDVRSRVPDGITQRHPSKENSRLVRDSNADGARYNLFKFAGSCRDVSALLSRSTSDRRRRMTGIRYQPFVSNSLSRPRRLPAMVERPTPWSWVIQFGASNRQAV